MPPIAPGKGQKKKNKKGTKKRNPFPSFFLIYQLNYFATVNTAVNGLVV